MIIKQTEEDCLKLKMNIIFVTMVAKKTKEEIMQKQHRQSLCQEECISRQLRQKQVQK